MELKVTKEYAGERLDVFLHSKYPAFSRSWIQKLIKKGNATVNPTSSALKAGLHGASGKKIQPSAKLKEGNVIIFELELPPEISLEPDEYLGKHIKIIFENDDFLVIDKPAGLSAHPSSNEPKGTLVNWLLAHYPPIRSVGDLLENRNIRPGIVHRLDKDTSGVMVVAKNQPTFLWLKKQFQQHLVIKKYITLVNGVPKEDSGKIELNIARSKSDPTKNIAARSKDVGRYALTYWKVLKRYPDHTLLEVTPKTGRLHQIRVHLKAVGLPVSGDKKYGSPRRDPKHLGRMFLHAEYLSFSSPDGEKFSFASPWPSELDNCLKNLPHVLT